jgi:formate dehydrogenase subunit gamma
VKGDRKAGATQPVGPHQAVIDDAIAQYAALPGPLLVVLHAIQDRIGFVPPEALPRIAQALNLSRAEVHGVVTFYHDFRTSPPGRHVVRVCQAESCQSMGSEALAAHAKARLGINFHETSATGGVTLEAVYCLGNCACSPAVTVDGRVHGRMTAERFDRLVEALE